MRPLSLLTLFFIALSGRAQVQCTVLKNASCANRNGIISAVASFGTGPYTYSIDGGIKYQETGYFGWVYGGNHTITAKDALGNISTGTCTVINNFNPPTVSVPTATHTLCNTTVGTITAVGAGGTPPYEYSLDAYHWQSGGYFTNLPLGWYWVYIRDANGCIGSEDAVVGAACPQADGIMYGPSWDCNTGGFFENKDGPSEVGRFEYSLDGINYQSNGAFANLPAGLYHLYRKETATGEFSIRGITVKPGCEFAVPSLLVHTSCQSATGSINATAQGGAQPYRYSLDGINFQNSGVFSGLAPGNYPIVAQDANGSLTSELVEVYNGCIQVNADVVHTTCGGNNGKITVNATGGTPPYRYSVDGNNFQTSNVFTPLPGATYDITVIDYNGINAYGSATINPSAYDLGVTTTVQNTTCIINNGSFTITGFGGTPPYEYTRDEITYQSSNTFNDLYYGPYPAGIRDANGCTFIMRWVDVRYVCFRVTGNTVASQCGGQSGSITAMTTDGTAPFTYSVDGTQFQTDPYFSGLAPGLYTITAKDANNETATSQVTVDSYNCITINNTITSSTCGNTNGSIQVASTNGTQPYTYSLDGLNFQSSNTFTSLSAGNYTVVVKDDGGSTSSASVILNNIPGPSVTAIATPATCDNNDGMITISAQGGTLPVSYSLEGIDFQNNPILQQVPSGNHEIMIKDANGCTARYPLAVPLQDNLILNTRSDTTICEGTSFTLNTHSNASSFAWLPATGLSNASAKEPLASPAASVPYIVTASKGICTRTAQVSISVNPAPVAYAGDGETICSGKSSQLLGSGGMIYEWTPTSFLSNSSIANPTVIRPSRTTTYSLRVTDQNRCSSLRNAAVTITVTPQAELFAGNDTSAAAHQPLRLNALDVNNSGFNTYSWSPTYGLDNPYISNPIATLDKDITYEVVARTSAGCESRDQIKIKVYRGPDIYVPNAFTPNNDGHNDELIPLPIGLKELKYFVVHNRWGQQVFRTNVMNKGWDGKIKGIPQNASSYVWAAEGIDYNGNMIKRSGTAVLVR